MKLKVKSSTASLTSSSMSKLLLSVCHNCNSDPSIPDHLITSTLLNPSKLICKCAKKGLGKCMHMTRQVAILRLHH